MKLAVDINRSYVRKDGKCAVRMGVSMHGVREWYPFPFAVEPSKWDAKLRRVKPGGNAVEYNRRIAAAISEAEVLAIVKGATAKSIVDGLRATSDGRPMLHGAMRKGLMIHTERFKANSQVAMLTMLKDFELRVEDMPLGDLTPAHVEHFHRTMKDRGLGHNTVSKRLRHLRTCYNTALVDNKLSRTSIFHGLIPREKVTHKERLSWEEFGRLCAYQPEQPAVMIARDTFILQVLLGGMRIGDAVLLRHTHFRKKDGHWELNYDMQKTGEEQWIPVPQEAIRIIDKYRGDKHVLPLFTSNRKHDMDWATIKVNTALKVVAAACDLPRNLSTHYARHTFGEWARKNKIDLKTLQMIFRHKSIKTTMVYMASFDTEDVKDTFSLLARTLPRVA